MTDRREVVLGRRFVLGRLLGSGGMGHVHAAYDRKKDETVALKTLIYATAQTIYHLKQEFRTLADIAHPNLVQLYELFCEENEWYFTMELVHGVGFLDYVRSSGAPDGERAEGSVASPLDERRLRYALQKLAEAVRVLHAAGKVHRDLKPSNVLVSEADRVVLLDFGISHDVDGDSFHQTLETSVPGTAVYMAPEQAGGKQPTEACDWYAVGVMLYEALTGQVPYTGDPLAVIYQKQLRDPIPPEELSPDVSPDLASICRRLLVRDPAERMTGDELLRCLGEAPIPSTPERVAEPEAIIGRERELAALEDAFNATKRNAPVSVYVHGPSGIGKSTLVHSFLKGLVNDRRAIVLSGRCYDRESMPYKAMDGVMDSLSRYLRSLPEVKIDGLLPRDVPAVARLFPVLLRVERLAKAPDRIVPDPLTLRKRAFEALRELFARITDRQAMVIYIDDFHWSDSDSVTLLDEILRPPDAPPVLLILCLRSEEIAAQPFLRSLLTHTGTPTSRELRIAPLSDEDACALARSVLPRVPANDPVFDEIVREADGSPFFIEQLARYAVESNSPSGTAGLTQMLQSRVAHLPTGSLALLETLAVAGHPVDCDVACESAGVTQDPRGVVAALRVSCLIRSSGSADRIELYHDRLRTAFAGALSPETVQQIHARLTDALRGADDPEALFEHSLGAGNLEQAAVHAIRAAERADGALAFDRAARFYRRALELAVVEPARRTQLLTRLGEALANAGKPALAAQAFFDASASTRPPEAHGHKRRAAEQLLIGGYNEQGLKLMRGLLKTVGVPMPAGPKRALLALTVARAQLALRGLGYKETPIETIDQIDLLRMDICFAAALGLAMVDPLTAMYFETRYLLMALDTGEPYRLTRAFAFEGGFTGAEGGPGEARARELHSKAQALAERLGSDREIALSTMTIGSTYCALGQFKQSAATCLRAEQLLKERCTGVLWELTTLQIYLSAALTYLGEIAELVRRVEDSLRAVEDGSNLFQTVELQTRHHFHWLVLDRPEQAREGIHDALARWTAKGFTRQHYNALLGLGQTDLYAGDYRGAHERLEKQWGALKQSLFLRRSQLLRCEMLYLRARCAIAAAGRGSSGREKLKLVDQIAERIARENMPWSNPLAVLARAAIAESCGNDTRAVLLFTEAAAGFDEASMALYAAVSRRRLGLLVGGDQGAELIRNSDRMMCAQKIVNPERMTDMLSPGRAIT